MNYYNGGNVLDNGCYINMIIGNRSTGKSFFFKRALVKRALDKGRKFIYLRRLAEDLKQCMPTWGDDIGPKFPSYRFVHKKNTIYAVRGEGDDKEETVIGYTVSLNGIGRLKSVPRGDVDSILYDEFLPDDGAYLRRSEPFFEPEQLLNLYMSTARGYKEVIRPNVQIICIANNTTLYNPYFSYFGVDLTTNNKYKRNGVYAERFINTDVAEQIKATDIGKFMESTRYGKYALNNDSLLDINRHIARPPAQAMPVACVYFNDWYMFYQADCNIYIRKTNDPTYPNRYKLTELDNDTMTPWLVGDVYKALKRTAANDRIYYDTMGTKSLFAGILQ